MKSPFTAHVASAAVAQVARNIDLKGFYDISTPGFSLELVTANRVTTRSIADAGQTAGTSPFDLLLLLQDADRSDNGYFALGDIQLRVRARNTDAWTVVASRYNRQPVVVAPAPASNTQGTVLTSADITASFGHHLPFTVDRT
ncbi:hypothetical protein DOTSEDRAFT_25376 [Dothistroma septosporum NZE10]|uniref:Uncharacterized protein n=1 Tax=Dothistroma septosporum (strain NZE10 / CBS 128990) TaxID=675120 RepID=M2Y5C5_DOTSN|nr:hypothetical protein DOTSEDRAFT_25376 [Dothistroma septosporum NZE10]